jgi:hypothetical protein
MGNVLGENWYIVLETLERLEIILSLVTSQVPPLSLLPSTAATPHFLSSFSRFLIKKVRY